MATIKSTLQINNAKLKKVVDRIVENNVERYRTAGNKANKELRKKYTIEWFISETDTMLKSLEFEANLRQKKNMAVLEFISYVNTDKYDSIKRNSDDTSIYRWMKKYEVTNFNAAEYIVRLQWDDGIHGLPATWQHPNPRFGQKKDNPPYPNPVFNSGENMHSFIAKHYETEWTDTVNKYLK